MRTNSTFGASMAYMDARRGRQPPIWEPNFLGVPPGACPGGQEPLFMISKDVRRVDIERCQKRNRVPQ